MTAVILQPAGNAASLQHYVNTIENPVSIAEMHPYLTDADLQILESTYPSNLVPTWGVTPGKRGQNGTKWGRLEVGDITLFSRSGRIVSSGILTHKIHSEDLAAKLWHRKEDGTTWEFVYFLDEITSHDIPVEKLNAVVGYKGNNVIQGFTVLDQEKSDRLIAYFDLDSSVYFPPVTEDQYLAGLDSESLDAPTTAKSRREQAFLRSNMFGTNREAPCCICGRSYPIKFLVAAHIKRRSECSVPERIDYRNIVAPMCKFGCDDLYEHHYIYVDDGLVRITNSTHCTADLSRLLTELNGRECLAWREGTRKYFDWHRNRLRPSLNIAP